MAATKVKQKYVLKPPAPVRSDSPGMVKTMPSPREMHHLHIFSNENYEQMVDFYCKLFNGEVVTVHDDGPPLTFISYDDHDHRVVIIKKPGWKPKAKEAIGVSHLAFAYSSLGELVYIYKRMKEWGFKPHWVVNHGNSTSFYYTDPDGNQIETMADNFASQETQNYKRYYQFTEEFGAMSEGNFDPDKMLALYEAGVPDTTLMDREQVRKMVREGTL